MPVFIFLLFLGGFFLWVLLAFLFVPVGKLVVRLMSDVEEAMSYESKERK